MSSRGGFSNNVLHAVNVDFRQVHPVEPQMLNDGELIIGATNPPNLRVNTLTEGTGISIVNGEGSITISSTGSNDLHVSRYIVAFDGTVGTGANFTSIQTAIDAANAVGNPATVFVQAGTYTENLTLRDGINIVGFSNSFNLDSPVKIVGKCTLASGTVFLDNIELRTNGDYLIDISGSATLNLYRCFLHVSNFTGILGAGSARINLLQTNGIGGSNRQLFTVVDTTLTFTGCYYISSNTTASTLTNGAILIQNSTIQEPFTTSGTSGAGIHSSRLGVFGGAGNPYIFNGTLASQNEAFNSTFEGTVSIGTGVTFTMCECVVRTTTANPISGAGTINYSGISYGGTGTGITTTTQVPRVISNDAIKIVTPGAYPYTVIDQDAMILVDTSAARAINLPASPATGQRHIIKDSVGTAGTFNITVTPAAGNIDGLGNYVITTNYGSIIVTYNGSEWSIS